MITSNSKIKKVKAVGLLSGGLDSTLAAKVIHDLGVDIYGVYFAMPWGCCNKDKARETAERLDIKFIVLQLDERYLEIVRKPRHGYGTAMNPCVDCRIHMFARARRYMESIKADFVFTGEVVGQRSMSQLKTKMKFIERETGLTGRLLRPLCAQFMDPTIPEQEGLVDRKQFLAFSGRSRRPQVELAERYGIDNYLPPAGGCLLTDQHFAQRMQDAFRYGYRNFRETIALKWGRHFRLSEHFKVMLGRNELENNYLKRYAHKDDYIMELSNQKGPTLILKGGNPTQEILQICAGLICFFSQAKDRNEAVDINVSPVQNHNDLRKIKARQLTKHEVESWKI